MSVLLAALSSELVKIAESEKHEQKPSYLRAVVAGLPVVAAQAASDVPESMIERGTENLIRKGGGLPSVGAAGHLGALRFGSRIGAGALTTPIFLSGMQDISQAKSKKDEHRGMAKLLTAGAAYATLRGGIEAGLDPAMKHLSKGEKLKRIVGPKTLMGLGAAGMTGMTVGRALQDHGKKDHKDAYLKPAAIGAALAGGKGLVEGIGAYGIKDITKSPRLRWEIGSRVGGKAAAGAASTLFLTQLMKRVLPGKEKKSEVSTPTGPTPAGLNAQTASWAKSAATPQLQQFYQGLDARGGERSPSMRAATYAVHDELTARGVALPALQMRKDVESRSHPTGMVDVAVLMGVATAPTLAWSALNTLPQSDRDRVLVDELDRLYVQNKIQTFHEVDGKTVQRGQGVALPDRARIAVARDVDPAELAHEIGHVRSGELRRGTLQGNLAREAHSIGSAAAVLIPLYVVGSSTDRSYTTKEELRSKANALSAMGVVAAAAQVPNLAEEALASAKGVAYLHSAGATKRELVEKTIKVLGPAFGTYAAPAAIPFVAAALLRHRAASDRKT